MSGSTHGGIAASAVECGMWNLGESSSITHPPDSGATSSIDLLTYLQQLVSTFYLYMARQG